MKKKKLFHCDCMNLNKDSEGDKAGSCERSY